MSPARKWIRPPKRPAQGTGDRVLEKVPEICPKCKIKLDPSRYHDCGKQEALF